MSVQRQAISVSLLTAASAAVLAVAGLSATGCRDDVPPFESQDTGIPASRGQLTTSVGDDRAPTWSPTSDSIIYSAEGFGDLPPARGVLVKLPRAGGTALELLKNVQLSGGGGASIPPWFTVPTVSPQGDRVAFVQVAPALSLDLFCNTGVAQLSCTPALESAPLPSLSLITLRVREFAESGPLANDPFLEVVVPGIVEQEISDPDPSAPPVFHVVHYYPFQQLHVSEGSLPFRASWAPDGERLVLSDGLRLLIWSVGSEEATAIPGTEDGMQPAWSPDGEWIAFTRFERVDSAGAVCVLSGFLGPCEGQERTDYLPGRRLIRLVRPDGGEIVDLTEGDEPAWTPDGSRIFFRNEDALWSIGVLGGEPVRVAGSEGGREPAVSPDGEYLAFAKRNARGDHDIWVAPLPR